MKFQSKHPLDRTRADRLAKSHLADAIKGVEQSVFQATTVIFPLSPIRKTLGKMTRGLKLMCGMPCLGASWSTVVQLCIRLTVNSRKEHETDMPFPEQRQPCRAWYEGSCVCMSPYDDSIPVLT